MIKIIQKYLLLTVIILYGLVSCQQSISNHKEKTFDFGSKLKSTSKPILSDKSNSEFNIDSAFSIVDNKYTQLRSIIKGNTLIVKFSSQDCDVCIKQVFNILRSEEFMNKSLRDIMVVTTGYSAHEALVLKNNLRIQYGMYISDFALRSLGSQTGPKLFIVTKEYIVRDLFIPAYDDPGTLKLYLRQVLNVQ